MNPLNHTNIDDLNERFAAAVARSEAIAAQREAAEARWEKENEKRAEREQRFFKESEDIARPILNLMEGLENVVSGDNTSNPPKGRFWTSLYNHDEFIEAEGSASVTRVKFSAHDYGKIDGWRMSYPEIDRPVPELRITVYCSGTIIEGNLNALRSSEIIGFGPPEENARGALINPPIKGNHGEGQDDAWIDIYHGMDVEDAKTVIVRFFSAQVPEHQAEIRNCLHAAPQMPEVKL